jgi:hypothetical protein
MFSARPGVAALDRDQRKPGVRIAVGVSREIFALKFRGNA